MTEASPLFRPVLGAFPSYRPGKAPVAAPGGGGTSLSSNESPYGPLPSVTEVHRGGPGAAASTRYPPPTTGAEALTSARSRRRFRGAPPRNVAVGCGVGRGAQAAHRGGGRAGRRGSSTHGGRSRPTRRWRTWREPPSVRVPLRDEAHDPRRDGRRRSPPAHPPHPWSATRTTRPAPSPSAAELSEFLDRVPGGLAWWCSMRHTASTSATASTAPTGIELYRDRPNVAVLRTFSKGVRPGRACAFGFLIGHPPVAEAVRKTMLPVHRQLGGGRAGRGRLPSRRNRSCSSGVENTVKEPRPRA